MNADSVQILIAMIVYMIIVLGIGVYFTRRAQTNTENYFLGGRTLGPWVTAMSAEASDMSGWLLMGLPGRLLVRSCRCCLDRYWLGSWHLHKLANRSQKITPL